MPPRHAYWTILVDNLPTAFRAADRLDLLPTFERLRRKHPSAMLMWFARGRLWPSPEAAMAAGRTPDARRGRDWRPGGEHRDPRERFKKERQERNAERRRERFEQREARGARGWPRPDRDAGRPAGGSRPPVRRPEEVRGERRPPPPGDRRTGGRDQRPPGRREPPRQERTRERPREAGRGGGRDSHQDRLRRADREGWRPRGEKPAERKGFGRPGPRGTGREARPDTGWRPPRRDAGGGGPRQEHAGRPRERGAPGPPDRKGPGVRQPWRDERGRDGARGGSRPGGGDRRQRPPSRRARPRPEPARERTQPPAPPPVPPPGPDRPPRPGEEPSPVPARTEESVTPTPPPERGRRRDGRAQGERPPSRGGRKP